MSCIRRWPAVRFAVNRTPRAIGRINRLIVSMITRTGISGPGVPSGRRCPIDVVGWFRRPIRTVANHIGMANPMFIDSWVVGVNVYGRRPRRLTVIRKIIKEVRIAAHLCPGLLIGDISWLVSCIKNQFCNTNRRLDSQRFVGAGNIIHGRRIDNKISGIPSRVGLKNWSKKLKIMVSFRAL